MPKISRRHLFGLAAGAAAAPFLPPPPVSPLPVLYRFRGLTYEPLGGFDRFSGISYSGFDPFQKATTDA